MFIFFLREVCNYFVILSSLYNFSINVFNMNSYERKAVELFLTVKDRK